MVPHTKSTKFPFIRLKCIFRKKLVDLLDLTLFNDWIYVNILIGITIALFSEDSFSVLLPLYLLDEGFTKEKTAVILSVESTSELLCRVIIAIVSLYIQLNARYVFLIGAIIIMPIRYGMFDTNIFQ